MLPLKVCMKAAIFVTLNILISDAKVCAAQADDVTLSMNGPWLADLGNGSYKNPVLNADYSDPDVVRVGSDYYLISSSFNCTPGLQILHSTDLVNWTIVGNVFKNQIPLTVYNVPQPANGVWAPSIRYHNNMFYVTYGDPDYGVYLAKAPTPQGPWDLKLIKSIKGWIDVCPFWDTNGDGYVVHAYANSRIGFSNMITIRKLASDDASLSDSIPVVDGNKTSTALLSTIEGPKLYKKDTYYYILAPAGGVTAGWQMALRATNINGPWEIKKVMEQGSTSTNGPHQGGWVTTPDEKESWFMHFQDKNAYGRVVHLEPMTWVNNWPVIGVDANNDGVGNPVATYKKPNVGTSSPITSPQTSDHFDADSLGLQWQWYANSKPEWLSLTALKGNLRLYSVECPSATPDYKSAPNLLLQKFCADSFSFTAKMTLHPSIAGDRAGVVVMGGTYALLALVKKTDGLYLTSSTADNNSSDVKITDSTVYFRIDVCGPLPSCVFKYSSDGKTFKQFGSAFTATKVKWIGAKIGLFALKPQGSPSAGYADFAWVNVDTFNAPLHPTTAQPFVKIRSNHGRLFIDQGFSKKSIAVGFETSKNVSASVIIYTTRGEKALFKKENTGIAGRHLVLLDKNVLARGKYFCTVDLGDEKITDEFFIIK